MAYKNIYRLAPYSERVSQLESYFKGQLNNTSIINAGKSRLQNDIDTLQAKEKALFIKLGVKNEDELEAKFQKINQELSHLSGTYLRNAFIEPLKAQGDKSSLDFLTAADELFKIWIEESQTQINEMTAQKIIELVSDKLIIDEKNSTKEIIIRRKGAPYKSRKESNFPDAITFILATPSRKRRLKELIEHEYKNQLSKKKKDRNVNFMKSAKSLLSDVTVSQQGYSTWFSITEKQTQSDAENISLQNRQAKSREILNLILPHVKGVDIPLFEQVFDYLMVESNYKYFYVGENINQVTGFLGELSGLYYLCRLFDCSPGQAGSMGVEWRGGKINPRTGHDYHTDIILQGKGVQIKNTTKDLKSQVMDIGFWGVKLDSFLTRMATLGLSASALSEVENYFRTYEFNVPYIKTKNGFEEKEDITNDVFRQEKSRLEQVANDVDILLSCFASEFMYLDVGRSIDDISDANLLFIMGNATIKTASSLLRKALQAMGSSTENTPIQITSHLEKGGYNIVSALNRDATLLYSQHQSEDAGKGLGSIKISTQYRFNLASFIPDR